MTGGLDGLRGGLGLGATALGHIVLAAALATEFCRGTPDEDEYMRRIGQAEELLNGHYRRLTRALREEMEQEAADLHFEQAAALRDRIRAIEVLGKRQKVIAGICADTDI